MNARRTNAYQRFEENLDIVHHALHMAKQQIVVQKRSDGERSGVTTPGSNDDLDVGERLRRIEQLLGEVTTGVSNLSLTVGVITHWLPVMLVAYSEAYIVNVLVESSRHEPSLVNNSKQAATLAELVDFDSIEALSTELRERWARNFVADGGPAVWIKRFESRGVKKFSPEVAVRLEEVWGVRHAVVHNAGRATRDFIARHPQLHAAVGQRIRVPFSTVKTWIASVGEFVDQLDAFYARYLPSDDAPDA